jgi:hypothetical protein
LGGQEWNEWRAWKDGMAWRAHHRAWMDAIVISGVKIVVVILRLYDCIGEGTLAEATGRKSRKPPGPLPNCKGVSPPWLPLRSRSTRCCLRSACCWQYPRAHPAGVVVACERGGWGVRQT